MFELHSGCPIISWLSNQIKSKQTLAWAGDGDAGLETKLLLYLFGRTGEPARLPAQMKNVSLYVCSAPTCSVYKTASQPNNNNNNNNRMPINITEFKRALRWEQDGVRLIERLVIISSCFSLHQKPLASLQTLTLTTTLQLPKTISKAPNAKSKEQAS